jgi:hypothetical protein
MKSWKKPTPEIVDKAVASMVRFEQQRYFFERLDNPGWLEALRKKGFFSNPPIPKRDDARGTIEFQQWPSVKYLSRMAAQEPLLVSEIMADIPDSDNPYIVNSFLDAALSMPPEIAERLTPQIAKMMRSPYVMRGHLAGDLAVHLARGGKCKSALALLESALEVIPDPRPVSEELKAVNPEYRHEARTRMAIYECQWIIQRNGPELVKLIGAPFLGLLCNLLERALSLEERRKQNTEIIEDYSYIWRSSLSSGETTDSPKRFLVPVILQNADEFSAQGIGQFRTVRKILAAKRFKVFERIELELIKRHLDIAQSAVAEKLTDKAKFEDIGLRYEYDDLSEKAFGLLSAPEQDQIFQWIDNGLYRDRLIERGCSQEEADDLINNWRLERLTPIKQFLPVPWQERYDTLKNKFGEPHRSDRRRSRGGAYSLGSRSSKTAEELEAMSVESLIGYLKTWRPDGEQAPFPPSEEGLGAVLTGVVAKNPAEFTKHVAGLKEVDPTYVRATLQGLESAIRSKSTFEWNPVLDLCFWVISQPIKIPDRTGGHWTKDPDWGWARQAIIGLIEQGFKEKALPFAQRDIVWQVIKGLAEHDPADHLDYRDPDSQSKDIWSFSVNRSQGRATRLAIQYIEWCRDNLTQPQFSLADVPEAEQLLNKGLDPSTEPSLDIRLVYGELLPFLISVDREWVEQNKARVFPEDDDKKALRDVAWVAYLVANHAYNNAFEVLQPLYWSAVQEVGVQRKVGTGNMMYNPDENLAHHLMQLYWRGRIGLEEHGILDEFLKRSNDEVLGQTITYIGRSLKDSTEEVSDETLERLGFLWDRCLTSVSGPSHMRKIAAFGWWFNSQYFEDDWALDHLHRSLQLSNGAFEPKLGTLERLAKLAAKFPKPVIACTQLIVGADYENVVLWVDDLKKILEVILRSGDPEAMRIARAVIQSLGMRGHHEYRVLLSSV